MAKQKNTDLDLEDLGGTIKHPIRWEDSSFGLTEDIWKSAQGIADLLPFPVQLTGDLAEETVNDATDKAKASELQVILWNQYYAELSKYLRNYTKIRQKQADLGEAISETRVQVAETDRALGEALASQELKFRQIAGNYRATIAARQSDLSSALGGISEKYKKLQDARQSEKGDREKDEASPFAKQKETMISNLRKKRDSKVTNFSAGITERVRAV